MIMRNKCPNIGKPVRVVVVPKPNKGPRGS